MVEEIKKKKPKDMAGVMMDFGFGGGLINGRKLEAFIEKMIGKKKFSDLSFPVTVVATDIDHGVPIKFISGELAPCIRASMSVPLFFRPAEIGGLKLVDGGLTRPVPVEEVKNMGADVVVAVNLDGGFLAHPATAKRVTLASVSQQALNIVRHHLSEYETRQADIVLSPDTGITSILGLKNFFDVDTLVALGRDSMNAELERLKKLIV
jgi:NTE family protein